MTSVHTLLRQQRGRYLWGVRLRDESLLSWQVGDPHLHLEPGRTVEGFECRFAAVGGRWQVAVLDGSVLLRTPLGVLDLRPDGDFDQVADEAGPHLGYLQGQALVAAEIQPTRILLRFDLETELELSGEHALLRVSRGDQTAEWTSEG